MLYYLILLHSLFDYRYNEFCLVLSLLTYHLKDSVCVSIDGRVSRQQLSDGQSIARGWVELYMSIWKAYKPIHMGICSVLSQI